MKFKPMLAAVTAAIALSAAMPAAAQSYRHSYRDSGRPTEIVVRSDSGERVVSVRDRAYRALIGNPYKFKPGRIYEYQDCGRGLCDVLIIDYFGRQRYDRLVAPPPPWERRTRWDRYDDRYDDRYERYDDRYDDRYDRRRR
jgi:hypothetical protein